MRLSAVCVALVLSTGVLAQNEGGSQQQQAAAVTATNVNVDSLVASIESLQSKLVGVSSLVKGLADTITSQSTALNQLNDRVTQLQQETQKLITASAAPAPATQSSSSVDASVIQALLEKTNQLSDYQRIDSESIKNLVVKTDALTKSIESIPSQTEKLVSSLSGALNDKQSKLSESISSRFGRVDQEFSGIKSILQTLESEQAPR